MAYIEVIDECKRYQTGDTVITANDHVNFQIEKGELAIVLGTEGDGLANDTIARCDYTVRIPMSHGVDSLNVAAASAVAFYQLGTLSRTEEPGV